MIKTLINITTYLAGNKENKKVVYLAGKVTGLEYSAVFAKFKEKQIELEVKGFYVINPLDHIAETEDWQKAMRISVIMLAVSDYIYLLNDWHLSTGAKLERNLSLPLGISTLEN